MWQFFEPELRKRLADINALRSQSLPGTDFKDPQQVLASLNTAFPGEENNDMFFTILKMTSPLWKWLSDKVLKIDPRGNRT